MEGGFHHTLMLCSVGLSYCIQALIHITMYASAACCLLSCKLPILPHHLSTLFLLLAGISPTTIWARVGDQANFSCSLSSDMLPTRFHLNEYTYDSWSMFPGYISNAYMNGVFTLFFNRTDFFPEPSVVRCKYLHCLTEPATIRKPGTYVQTLVSCYPISAVARLFF